MVHAYMAITRSDFVYNLWKSIVCTSKFHKKVIKLMFSQSVVKFE